MFFAELVKNTPPWVFLLLGYIVWQGLQATRTQTVSVWRLVIVPTAFIVMGLSRLALGQADGPWPPLAWLAAAFAMASLGLATGPRLLAVDRARKLVTRRGSVVPLCRNMLVFVLQYSVAVEAALHPDSRLQVVLIGRAIPVRRRAISSVGLGHFEGATWPPAPITRHLAAATGVLRASRSPPSTLGQRQGTACLGGHTGAARPGVA